MKQFELRVLQHDVLGNVQELNYKDQLIGLVSVVETGMTIIDMRKIEKVVDKLEAVQPGGWVELEDEEHLTLKAALERAQFRIYTKAVKNMIDSVLEAEDFVFNKPLKEAERNG